MEVRFLSGVPIFKLLDSRTDGYRTSKAGLESSNLSEGSNFRGLLVNRITTARYERAGRGWTPRWPSKFTCPLGGESYAAKAVARVYALLVELADTRDSNPRAIRLHMPRRPGSNPGWRTKFLLLAGTGRRGSLKKIWRNPSRFESSAADQVFRCMSKRPETAICKIALSWFEPSAAVQVW